MRKFKLVQSKTEVITPHDGLALIGLHLNQMTSLHKTSRDVAKRHGITNIELIRTYLGLVSLDMDVFSMDNNNTKKEGFSYT